MPMQTFVIHAKAISWNSVACKHWRVYSKLANEWKMITLAALNKAKVKPCTVFPIEISVHCKWKSKKIHDIDSLFTKSIVDQLKASKIIPDDSLEYVDKISFGGEVGAKSDEIIVVLTSL